jgi:ectoine hydroxylase-related dioxygenase (phytanoyl-CoA dioxygenase family)
MTTEDVSVYGQDGYLVCRNLLSKNEVAQIRQRVRGPIEADIREGKTCRVIAMTKADESQIGFLGREQRLVDLAQDAIGAPIYRYRHLLMPNIGFYEWHQDFDWHFANGLLAPQIATIYMPLDKATRENGCIRVLKGSHKLGRLNHPEPDHVDQKQLQAARQRFDLVYVEMEPGDVMVFHGHLLHSYDANRSNTHLATYQCYYNAVENAQHYKEDRISGADVDAGPYRGDYEAMEKVSASAFLAAE